MIAGILIGVLGLVFVIVVSIWLVRINPYKIIHSNVKKKISAKKLADLFLKLDKKNPFSIVQESDLHLSITWKIVSAKWLEVLGNAWKNKTYLANIVLDEDKKCVLYSEKIIEKETTKGAIKAYASSTQFKGTLIPKKEQGKQYGIQKDFSIGEIYDYSFSPSEIKGVIMQIALENGWDFKMSLLAPK